ncbi:MAG: L,D-transpeptidase [Myxococcota bacterium]
MKALAHVPFLLLVCLSVWACGEEPSDTAPEVLEPDPEPTAAEPLAVEPEPEPEPEGPPPRLYTKRWVVTVREAPHTTGRRIGYLRAGALLMSASERLRSTDEADEDCVEGFYELEGGGFVCAPHMIPFHGDRVPRRPGPQPDREARLPYRYGYARRDMTPVYRRFPTDEEAVEHEGYVIPGTEPEEGEDTEVEAAPTPPPADAPQEAASVPAGIGGVEGQTAPAEDAEEAEPEPPPRLDDLRYRRGLLRRHLMRGFYVSLDRPVRTGNRGYWRTLQGSLVPRLWLGEREGSDYTGATFDDAVFAFPALDDTEEGTPAEAASPGEEEEVDVPELIGVAFALRRALPYFTERNGRIGRSRSYPPRTPIPIAGRIEHDGTAFLMAPEGRLLRESDAYFAPLPTLPEGVSEDEKWVDVNLERQTLVAYRGTRPVFATLISSGIVLRPGVEDADHRTPGGTFRINVKHLTRTMDADNELQGPYSVDDVPYVMYYEGNFALHAAFWHDAFGRPKSHGCINMAPRDANWLFSWTEPALPEGWHGVYPEEETDGTLIHIHGETPSRRR